MPSAKALFLPRSWPYPPTMLRLGTTLALLVGCMPAQAMNWEGHDDGYMEGFPHAEALRAAAPHALPLPSRPCPVTPEMAAANPYEQIPLPRHRCAAGATASPVER